MIVNPDFFDHWKTRQLAGELDNDDRAAIYVMRLWAHCQRSRRWSFPQLSASALKGICTYPGPAERLWQAMQSSAFIVVNEQVVVVHEWEVYNASLVAAWENGSKGGRPVTRRKPKDNPRDTHGIPMGDPTREERIGVDRIGTDNTPEGITALVASLASRPAYAGIDVAREADKCAVWCERNRKTFSERRLINWLNRVDAPMSGAGIQTRLGANL